MRFTPMGVIAFGTVQFAIFAAVSVLYEAVLKSDAHLFVRDAASAASSYLMFVFPNSFYGIVYGLTSSVPISLLIVGVANAWFYVAAARSTFLGQVSAVRLLLYFLALSALTYFAAIHVFFRFFFMQPS
jgi:hypothetical protein